MADSDDVVLPVTEEEKKKAHAYVSSVIDTAKKINSAWWDEGGKYAKLLRLAKGRRTSPYYGHALQQLRKDYPEFGFRHTMLLRKIMDGKLSDAMIAAVESAQHKRIDVGLSRKDTLAEVAPIAARKYLQNFLKDGIAPINE